MHDLCALHRLQFTPSASCTLCGSRELWHSKSTLCIACFAHDVCYTCRCSRKSPSRVCNKSRWMTTMSWRLRILQLPLARSAQSGTLQTHKPLCVLSRISMAVALWPVIGWPGPHIIIATYVPGRCYIASGSYQRQSNCDCKFSLSVSTCAEMRAEISRILESNGCNGQHWNLT